MINTVNGQDLQKHRWENRIVLLISRNDDSKEYLAQMDEFSGFSKELEDRKLFIYQVLPLQYRTVNYPLNADQNKWISSSGLYTKYTGRENKFKVILIGLDGGIKLEKFGVLTSEELFKTIDSMSMRRAEMQNKSK
tara:strand:- start:8869 stop:9276 length:408 start_codon:yes stop_codon:yes gene_type:complete